MVRKLSLQRPQWILGSIPLPAFSIRMDMLQACVHVSLYCMTHVKEPRLAVSALAKFIIYRGDARAHYNFPLYI